MIAPAAKIAPREGWERACPGNLLPIYFLILERRGQPVEIRARLSVFGLKPQRCFELDAGLRVPADARKDYPEVGMRFKIIRPETECLLKMLNGVRQPAQLRKGRPQVLMGFGKAGP